MDWVNRRSLYKLLIVLILYTTCVLSPTYCYDALDPNGNITIRWDVMQESDDSSQDITLSIINYQLFRHIEVPGWKLSWEWPSDEVIWSITGAEATERGNCSAFKGKQLPHCCDKQPVIVDLLPGAPFNQQTSNCCRGGVLTSMNQDSGKYLSRFQMNIGSAGTGNGSGVPGIPGKFDLGVPGYTCGEAFQVPPTKFTEDHGRRRTQAFATWNVTCSYSQFRAASAPTCCVALSAFYSETIVPCPKCSCACQGQAGNQCVKQGKSPPALQMPHNEQPKPVVKCSDHMCPIKIHWHIKLSYTQYWRVKITITNFNYVKNYSDWNLVVLHPNLRSTAEVFSFNYKPLYTYGNINDTGMFYGIPYYNDMLLQSGKSGNVQTELLLYKDPGIFTFREGWAFPRKISFNGEECVMPSPDDYPKLPNAAQFHARPASFVTLLLLSLLLVIVLS